MHEITLDTLRAALCLPDFDYAPAHLAMSPSHRRLPDPTLPPREAGVLALVYPRAWYGGESLHIVLTRRNEALRGHSGQISFPGGKRDPDDPSFVATALRETCEELGICGAAVTVLGELNRVYIPPSNFLVTPIVGYMPQEPHFRPNPDEVAEVFSVPLAQLLDTQLKRSEERDVQGVRLQIPLYALGGHQVWGATGVMLSELEYRLRRVMNAQT